jgi:nucleoside-diphosphate-sugar epimerase
MRYEHLDSALCLVTGGAGYIAHGLTLELLARGAKVRRLYRADGRKPAFEHPSVEDVAGDVAKRSDLERASAGVDVVFHLAERASVHFAENDPAGEFEANVRPLIALGEICLEKTPVPKLVFASTAHPDAPLTIHDLHKLMAEQYLEFSARIHGLAATTLRLCDVYGPGPPSGSSDHRGSRSERPREGVLNEFVRRAMNGEALTVYGDGREIRDYVFIADVARAFIAAAEASKATTGGHFVVGSGRGHSIADAASRVASIVGKRLGKPVAVSHAKPPQGLSGTEQASFVADPEPFEKAAGFRATTTLDEGLERTLDHFLDLEKGGQQ